MPTYVCSVSAGSLSADQKSQIAAAICLAHNDATGAPGFLVQVVIDEKPACRFLGGRLVTDLIWIRGDIRSGRTTTQRQTLITDIMKRVSLIAGLGEESIWVYLCNLEPTDMMEYGQVLPQPGQEFAWFEALPKSLQSYLAGLGAAKGSPLE